MSLVAVGLVVFAESALANFGSQGTCGDDVGSSAPNGNNCVSLANNRWHAVRPIVLGNQWLNIDDNLADIVNDEYDPTDLVAYITTTDSVPDVWAYDYYYPMVNLVAWVDCPEDNSGTGSYGPSLRWCRGQNLWFNASLSGPYSGNSASRGIACHELGHTVGLRHTTSTASCMASKFVQDPPIDNLSSHDKTSHLNPFY